MRVRKFRIFRPATAFAVVLSAVFAAEAGITVDLLKKPFKDQRTSRAGTGAGYAGNMSDDGANAGTGRDLFVKYFIEQPDECWKILKEGGCHVCREWSANDRWQERIAPFKAKDEKELKKITKRIGYDTSHDWNKIAYDFRKKHGIRTLLTLENYSVCTNYVTGARSDDIADVKRVILEFVQWIVDNGYKDQVIGFELGNEPYFGSDPERFAERWAEIVPEIKRIFPEVDIGFTCAEYREGDPDIDAVRRRSTAVDKWFEGGSYFGFQKVNQWTGRFIVAFTNGLPYCNHVIYHFYGGDVADGMGPCGFGRIRHFAKAFPEVANLRVWVTEYRERSDEDCRCEQMFSSTLTKGHYVLSTTAAPMFDCTSIHQISALSGGFCVADGKGEWIVQWDPAGRNFTDPDFTGRPRIEVGPAGPMYKIYNEALMDHPIILENGVWFKAKDPEQTWTGVLYYGSTHKIEGWYTGGEKGPRPKAGGGPQWVVAANPEMTSVAVLVCNSSEEAWTPGFDFPGFRIVGKAHVRTFCCPPEMQQLHQIPGEPRPTWQEEYDVEPAQVKLPGTAVATVVYTVERAFVKVGLLADTHVTADAKSTALVKKAFDFFARQKVDVLAHLGDLADTHDAKAYANYAAARAAAFTNGLPRETFSFGFHDAIGTAACDDWTKAADAYAAMRQKVGAKQEGLFDSFELGGYTFLVAPEWPERKAYEKLVADACAKAGGKPVFLFQHRPPYATTAKSTDFGSPDCYVRDDERTLTRGFLDKYPNLIVFSGHVHASLADPRAVWQGPFTAVCAGGLACCCEPYAANPNAATNATVLVMSVFAKSIELARYDLAQGRALAAWTLPIPYDPAATNNAFTAAAFAKRCSPGVFTDNNSKVTVSADPTGVLLVKAFAPHDLNGRNTCRRQRVELAVQSREDVQAAHEARYTGEKAGPAEFRPVSRCDIDGFWTFPEPIAAWWNEPGPRTARFSGALIPAGAKLKVTVTPEAFDGTLGKPREWTGPMPAFEQPKPKKKGEKAVKVPLVAWEEVWSGAGVETAVKGWPGGKVWTPPAEAWQGAKGRRFRVSFAFAASVEETLRADVGATAFPQAAESVSEFELLDATGRVLKAFALPGLGLEQSRRYAVEFEKPADGATFALRIGHTRAASFALADIKIERVK